MANQYSDNPIYNFFDNLVSSGKTLEKATSREREKNADLFNRINENMVTSLGQSDSPLNYFDPAMATAGVLADWNLNQQIGEEQQAQEEENKKRSANAMSNYQEMLNTAYNDPRTLAEVGSEYDYLMPAVDEFGSLAPSFSLGASSSPGSPSEGSQPEPEQSPEPKERSETWGMNQGPNALKRAWDAEDVPWDPGYGSNMSIADLQAAGVNVAEDPYEDAKKVTGIPRHVDNLNSMREEFYDWMLNSEAGREFALAHPEFAVENNGYTRFRELADPNLYAQWALDDPRVARRWLNAGIDINDTEALAENIGDYFNDHTINIGDYMKNQDASYVLGYDTNTIGELGNYLEDLYGYNFLADYAKAHNLDSGDLTAQMLARQLATTDSGLYMNPNEISDFLVKEGYLSPEERFSYTNEGSDLYSNYGGWMENSRAYGIPALDVYDSTVNGNFDDYVADSILSSLNQGLIDSGSTVRVGSSKAPSAKKAEKTE